MRSFQQSFSGSGEFEFVAGSVFGVRRYNLQTSLWLSLTNRTLLTGATGVTWSGTELEAECHMYHIARHDCFTNFLPCSNMSHRRHAVPDDRCSCGIYAYWDVLAREHSEVWAVVEGSGRTLIGSKGFRTQRAKIVALAWEPYTSDWPSEDDWNRYRFSSAEQRRYLKRLKRQYPVPFYESIGDMLSHHPTTRDYRELQ